ncbi:MAG: aminopeptidase [Clostridia bacterium]|nr:aminopeptidase [Clostridia bacterium]
MQKDYEKAYAELIIKKGVSLKKGQEVFLVSSVETFEFARKITECAYENGAKKVTVLYTDEKLNRQRFLHESKDSISHIENWEIAQRDYIPDNKCAYICILSESPDAYANCDADKVVELSRARHKAFVKFYDMSKGDVFKWCLVGYPSKAWADKVFPSDPSAYEKLKSCIFSAMRLDSPDPVKAWEEHSKRLKKSYTYLNKMQFDEFVYTNSLGTALKVGMPKNYLFAGGGDETVDGDPFIANMPTEEVFSAPHKRKVNGIVYASMPLIHNGQSVEDFYFEFADGKVVSYGAKKGKEVLDGILTTDEGACYLGEIALVAFDTPIRSMNTLFYNTLYDENASCHFALGSAYTSSVEGAEKMSREEQEKVGLNYSLEHVDFMIGTRDLKIVGIKNGVEYPIFEQGNWAINFEEQ